MAVLSKPIPALYTVYVLRSTVRHASLYIGSTPNPPRRLKQHNGQVRGGAARTSRPSLRPWEMVAIVSGFPGMVAALKFEWALTNPHLSLHIPPTERLASADTQARKRNGQPRRPRASLVSVLSNLHLLLRVPSFARWPLRLHFFAPDVHRAWEGWCAAAVEPAREGLVVERDFGPGVQSTKATGTETGKGEKGQGEHDPESPAPWGIDALPLTYEPLRSYIAKGRCVFDPDPEHEYSGDTSCVVCSAPLNSGEGGLHALCPNEGCEAVGHMACWAGHILAEEKEKRKSAGIGTRTAETEESDGDIEAVLPVCGTCPRCGGDVQWGEMMTELTLRVRGTDEVEKLLRKKRRRAEATEE